MSALAGARLQPATRAIVAMVALVVARLSLRIADQYMSTSGLLASSRPANPFGRGVTWALACACVAVAAGAVAGHRWSVPAVGVAAVALVGLTVWSL
jgi:hypothetical protein